MARHIAIICIALVGACDTNSFGGADGGSDPGDTDGKADDPSGDGGVSDAWWPDVPFEDASVDAGFDGGAGDAGFDGGFDASMPDAGMDAGVPCMVGTMSGTCQSVATCTGVSTPGFCPGPSDIQCCTPAAAGECDPSAMPTPNAGLVEEPGDPGCPDGMARSGSICIDRFEASLVLIDASGAAVGSWSPYHNPGSRSVAAVSLRGAVPQGYISGRQAADACDAAGKRLCTNDEWLAACRGAEGRTYPYGNTRLPGVCNDARATHPAVERFGTNADWIWSRLGDACINQLDDSLARTGDHPDCVTPEGVLDMMGNLHEWTSDSTGVFRGGFYADTRINGEGCLYRTGAHDTGHFDYSTGFRCCADR